MPRRQEISWEGAGAGVRAAILAIVVSTGFLEEVSAPTSAGQEESSTQGGEGTTSWAEETNSKCKGPVVEKGLA